MRFVCWFVCVCVVWPPAMVPARSNSLSIDCDRGNCDGIADHQQVGWGSALDDGLASQCMSGGHVYVYWYNKLLFSIRNKPKQAAAAMVFGYDSVFLLFLWAFFFCLLLFPFATPHFRFSMILIVTIVECRVMLVFLLVPLQNASVHWIMRCFNALCAVCFYRLSKFLCFALIVFFGLGYFRWSILCGVRMCSILYAACVNVLFWIGSQAIISMVIVFPSLALPLLSIYNLLDGSATECRVQSPIQTTSIRFLLGVFFLLMNAKS